ncbi:DUF6588 family protein [Candidatus Eisenbacteria bacterium]|uniref:DUF6588 family protein n=1 Tax=Eiseniibacteriota bacterium TaxID=2212470 RepID=A0ABV6YND2_UNCEI
MSVRNGPIIGLVLGLLVLATAASASIEDQLSVYGEANAKGYLEPLVDAAGADLSLGLFESAYIPTDGWFVKIEVRGMGTWLKNDEKTFMATTEDGFSPETTTDAPTVVGPGEAVEVENEAGAKFFFPGGFDLNSLALATPQIRFGAFKGTEGLIRFAAGVIGDNELGDLQLWGVGVRHSISQYLNPDLGYNIAAGFMYSNFKAGKNKGGNDMFDITAWTLGAQGSKIWRKGGAAVEPYVGLSVDSYSGSVEYQSEAGTPSVVDVKYDASYGFRASLGLLASVQYVAGQIEYNLGSRNSITFSLGFGKY